MSQDHFDRKLRDRINAIESDVPASIWDGIAAQNFDQQFRDRIAPVESEVPQDMWQAVAAQQFDQTIASRLQGFESVVPATSWAAIERMLKKKNDRTPILILLLLLLLGGAGTWIGSQLSLQKKSIAEQRAVVAGNHEEDNFARAASPITQQEAAAPLPKQDAAGIKPPPNQGPPVTSSTGAERQNNQQLALPLPLSTKGNLKETKPEPPNLSDLRDGRDRSISQENDGIARVVERAAFETATIDLLDLSGVSPQAKPRIECPTLKVSRSLQPFYELTLSPGFPMRSLEDSADNDAYLETRKATEKPTTTLSIDAVFGVEIKDFEIKTGVSISQIHEVFDYIDQTSTRTVIDTLFDPNTGEVIDISIVREYGTRVKKTNNRYTFIDIPLIVGYRFRPRKDHSLWIRAGGYLNLLFAQRGSILSASDDLIDLKEEGSTIFKKTAGLQATASVGYEIDFSDKNSLGLQMSYRHPLSQLTLDSYPIRQQYQRLQVGFSWKHKL